jgi:hypothetical protein
MSEKNKNSKSVYFWGATLLAFIATMSFTTGTMTNATGHAFSRRFRGAGLELSGASLAMIAWTQSIGTGMGVTARVSQTVIIMGSPYFSMK